TVTVTDEAGCTVKASATNTQTAKAVSGSISSSYNVTCFNCNKGQATAQGNGGNPPYTYHWSGGHSANPATGLSAGSFTCTILDSNGCSVTISVTVTQPAPLTDSMATTSVSCPGGSNGTATVMVAGGTMPYNYTWSNGQTGATVTGLTSGIYSVSIADNNGCTLTS